MPKWTCFYSVNSYCPSVFMLEPGQTLHIPKGLPLAFRKMEFEELPPNDCHAVLRRNMIGELKKVDPELLVAPLCISVAYDW